MYTRHARASILDALEDTPSVLVMGARQAGKSTLVKSIRGDAYVTLDLASTRSAAASDPDGFVAGLPDVIALDEIQRVPELFLSLKAEIDARRQAGRFLLTGSANVLLLPHVADALPGRMEICEVWPLTQGEIDGQVDGFVDAVFASKLAPLRKGPELSKIEVFDRVLRGGFPEVIQRPVRRRHAWFESYLTAILEREVRDLAQVTNTAELTAMVRLLAVRNASLLNLADIARDAGLSHSTARRYLRWLEAVFLVVELPAWSTNLSAKVVKAPKVIWGDSGLAAHLLGVDRERFEADPTLAGGLLEGFVAMEVRKQLAWAEHKVQLGHFRSRRNEEVDLVLERRNGDIVGVETKGASTVRASDFDGLKALQSLTGRRFRRGILLYTGQEAIPFGPELWALPMSALWRLHH